jgi:hypothetical protein
MANDNKEFPQKYAKKLPQEFVDAVSGMSDEEIKARLLTCEGNIYEVENAKASDEKLFAARELAKDLASPYRDSKAIENAKIQWCLFTLESRGINLN